MSSGFWYLVFLEVYRRFGGRCCIHLQDWSHYAEDVASLYKHIYKKCWFSLIRGEGWVSVHLARRLLVGLLYQPRMMDVYGAFRAMRIGRGNRRTRENLSLTLCSKFPNDLTYYRTREVTVEWIHLLRTDRVGEKEAPCWAQTFVFTSKTARCHNPEDTNWISPPWKSEMSHPWSLNVRNSTLDYFLNNFVAYLTLVSVTKLQCVKWMDGGWIGKDLTGS